MLTVLLATRNRAGILHEALESFCQLQPPSGGWRLVVVDNGSADQTGQVIDSFVGRLPLRSVMERQLGKNIALNTGLNLVEGDLTVLTDDDVFPHADWLIQLRKAADTQTAYSMFGGVIVPRWEVPPPPWVRWLTLAPIYSLTDPSLKEGPLLPILVFGPNMAIRTSIFESGIRFDTAIGPRGSSYPMGSETELVVRLSRLGHNAWHVSGAVVEHLVRAEQLKKAWVWQRARHYGRGRFRMSPSLKLWMGMPRHLLRDIPKEAFLMAAAWAFFRHESLFRARWRFNVHLGRAIEARIAAQERSRAGESAPR